MPGTLELIEKVAKFIDDHKGGVIFQSDRVTYPKSLGETPATVSFKESNAFRLSHANAVTADDEIVFVVQGSFGSRQINGAIAADQPVMKNVFFTLDQQKSTDVFGTSVDFHAVAGDPVGLADAPRIPFFIKGNFSSLGAGSCNFDATLEIDREGNIFAIATRISGNATIDEVGTIGQVRVTL